MRSMPNLVLLSSVLLLCSMVTAAPRFKDLQQSFDELPWIYEGDVIRVESHGATAVVLHTFRGDASPGDTLHIPYWEMGSWMAGALNPSEGILLVPDSTGALQITGTPGNGFWLLRGYFDFNAYIVDPGVLNRRELELLCSGDTIPPRCVDIEVRFAGGSEFIDMEFSETDGTWRTRSPFQFLDALELDRWAVRLGGAAMYPFEPPVRLQLPAAAGGSLVMEGRVLSCTDGRYRCIVYPTEPVIRSAGALTEYRVSGVPPDPPIIDVLITGIDPVDAGLTPEPWMTTDPHGDLHLSGAGEMLDITSLASSDFDPRPAIGFDTPMTCSDPLYFDLSSLPPGPSGHLATDILDALEKGVVSGSLSPDGDPDAPRFSLSIRRE